MTEEELIVEMLDYINNKPRTKKNANQVKYSYNLIEGNNYTSCLCSSRHIAEFYKVVSEQYE